MRTFVQAVLIVCWLLMFGFAMSHGKSSEHSYPTFKNKLAAYKVTVVEVNASVSNELAMVDSVPGMSPQMKALWYYHITNGASITMQMSNPVRKGKK